MCQDAYTRYMCTNKGRSAMCTFLHEWEKVIRVKLKLEMSFLHSFRATIQLFFLLSWLVILFACCCVSSTYNIHYISDHPCKKLYDKKCICMHFGAVKQCFSIPQVMRKSCSSEQTIKMLCPYIILHAYRKLTFFHRAECVEGGGCGMPKSYCWVFLQESRL